MNEYAKNVKWRTSTGLAFWGTVVQTAFSFIGTVFLLYLIYNVYDMFLSALLPYVVSRDFDSFESVRQKYFDISIACFVMAALAYIIYLIGICMWKGAQRSIKSDMHVRDIILAEFIMPAEVVIFYVIYYTSPELIESWDSAFPILLCAWAAIIVAVILLLVQFKSLSKEETWSERARKGADDLRFSYSLVLWIQGVLILGFLLIFLTVYSTISKFQSTSIDKFGNVISVAQEVQNLVGIIKVIMMFVCLIVSIFAVILIIYRIMGWYKIKVSGNEEVYQFASKQAVYTGPGRFCHKCGMPLPEGSAFCPGCGAPVATGTLSESVEAEQPSDSETTEVDATLIESASQSFGNNIVYEDEESDNKKKWMLWCDISVGVIVLGALVWALFLRSDKFEPNAKVFVDSSYVFKSIPYGNNDAFVAQLGYNSPVQIVDNEHDDEIWTEVMYEDNGKVKKGFINKFNLMNMHDFTFLDAAGFKDAEVRNQIPQRMQRLAVSYASSSLEGKYSLEKIDNSELYANAKYVWIRNASPSEQCFAFSMVNNDDSDERKVFVYSTPDIFEEDNIKNPYFLFDENIPVDKGSILDVTFNKKNNRYDVSYLIRSGYCGDDEIESEMLVEEYPAMYAGPNDLKGQIDGKYDISMTFYESNDHSLSGWYKYLKNDVAIDLSGKFYNDNDVEDHLEQNLVIDEYVDGKKTGTFYGKYDGESFIGQWENADGSKAMGFRLER